MTAKTYHATLWGKREDKYNWLLENDLKSTPWREISPKHDALIERSRKEVMQHMLQDNLGLITPRRVETKIPWTHLLCTNKIVEHVAVSLKTIDYLFPLYVYQRQDKPKKRSFGSAMMLFEPSAEYGIKKPNLSVEIVGKLSTSFKKTLSPEEIFYYIYAILYSETYRTKYAEFLKIDFPRVPFTASYKLFKKMSEYGNRLADLHLLKSVDLDNPIARFQGMGNNRVEKPRYEFTIKSPLSPLCQRGEFKQSPTLIKGSEGGFGCIYINTNQYFEGISPQVWSYQVGGYQVCEKWLKDRKQRILTLEEIQTYCRIVTALHKTIEIQKSIDEVYEEVEL